MRLVRRQRGQGLVEFAVIFPIFAFLLFTVIDGGLMLGRYNNVNNATKEGARLGAVDNSGTFLPDIMTRVKLQAHGILDDVPATATGNCTLTAKGNEICVNWIAGPTAADTTPGQVGTSVRVVVKYQYPFLTPIANWVGSGGWTIEACAVQRLERLVPPPAGTAKSGEKSCADFTG